MDTFLVSDVNATFLLKKLETKAAVVRCKHSITCAKQKKQYNNFSFFDNSGFAKLVCLFETKSGSLSLKIGHINIGRTRPSNTTFCHYLYFLRFFSRKILALSPAILALSPGILALRPGLYFLRVFCRNRRFGKVVLSEVFSLFSPAFFVFSPGLVFRKNSLFSETVPCMFSRKDGCKTRACKR